MTDKDREREKEVAGRIPEKQTGIKRILRAFIFSRDGFLYMLKEAAFRQELMLTIVAGVVLCFIDISLQVKLLMIASLILVMIVEALNTGLEVVIDMISPEYDPRAKAVKDIGSLAVLMSFALASIVWFCGFYK